MGRFRKILSLGGLQDDLEPGVRWVTVGLLLMILIGIVILVTNLIFF
jgi:hypothetical protein